MHYTALRHSRVHPEPPASYKPRYCFCCTPYALQQDKKGTQLSCFPSSLFVFSAEACPSSWENYSALVLGLIHSSLHSPDSLLVQISETVGMPSIRICGLGKMQWGPWAVTAPWLFLTLIWSQFRPFHRKKHLGTLLPECVLLTACEIEMSTPHFSFSNILTSWVYTGQFCYWELMNVTASPTHAYS